MEDDTDLRQRLVDELGASEWQREISALSLRLLSRFSPFSSRFQRLSHKRPHVPRSRGHLLFLTPL